MNQTLAGLHTTPLPSTRLLQHSWHLGDRASRYVVALILILQCCLPIWLSLADHPLYAPDEGRYGSVSANMLESGNWLVPMKDGHPHLTKPPLIYWLQATSMRLVDNEVLALRLPSVIAATLTVLLTFGLGAYWAGAVRGLIAAGLLSLMPLHLVVGRLAITDSLLTFFWIGALAAGIMAVHADATRPHQSKGWAALLWLAVALGLLTKGPLALVPVGLLLLWLLLSGQRNSIRRLHIIPGVLCALVPIGLWVFLITRQQPEAIAIWRHEILDRASGSGDHPEPVWYYLPIVIAGLFPATATLSLPGIEYSWRDGWDYCRSSNIGGLLALAVILPLVGFTIMSGKLATYVLPLGPPLALLAAAVLESRFIGVDENATGDRKAIRTISAVFVSASIVLGIMVVATVRLGLHSVWTASLAAVLPLAALSIWRHWSQIALHPRRRLGALALLWVAGLIAWFGALEFEDSLDRSYGTEPLMAQVHAQAGLSNPIVATVGYDDPTLFHYLDHSAIVVKTADVEAWLDSLSPEERGRTVLLANGDTWIRMTARHPQLHKRFKTTGRGTYRLNTPVLILRPVEK